MRIDEIGVAQAWTRDDDNAFNFHPDCWPALKDAWMRGQAFFEGHGLYGELVILKLGAVVAIAFSTPEIRATHQAELEDQRKRDAIDGAS